MDDLITWLRAQLDEDERKARPAARAIAQHDWHDVDGLCQVEWEFVEHFDPARVLRKIEAERALLAETICPYLGADTTTGRVAWLALRLLALPYSDRPGYREEWRP